MGKSVNDCYFYYGGICFRGDKCYFRHEPRARGSRFICTRWLRRSCTNARCPLRHSLYDVHPLRIWEDRRVYTPFLKSYFLGRTPGLSVRGDDRNTLRRRRILPNRLCRSTKYSRDNRNGVLRSTQMPSYRPIEFSGDLVQGDEPTQTHQCEDPCGYFLGNGELQGSIRDVNGNLEDRANESGFIDDGSLFQSITNSNDDIREEGSGSSENGHKADVNVGSNKSDKTREFDPMNLTLTFKINQNTHLKVSEGNGNLHGLTINCCKLRCDSEHEKRLDLKFLEKGERDSAKICSHSGSNRESFDENGTIALRFSITLDEHSLCQAGQISIPSRQNQVYTSPDYIPISPNDANGERNFDGGYVVSNTKKSTHNRRAKAKPSSSFEGGGEESSLPSTNRQRIPPIRLKRSRSAGSKDTWKIRRPRSKTTKRSPRKAHSSRKERGNQSVEIHPPAAAPANEALVFCECKLRETLNSNPAGHESPTQDCNGVRVRASRSVSV